eukprot:GHVR01085147.1.p1 GENE.GHVR01085147.1~~GHVR01085147.1.p1  ORF type:complete len:157 (-),score=61.07 GHVR01085147.1:165-635(-)
MSRRRCYSETVGLLPAPPSPPPRRPLANPVDNLPGLDLPPASWDDKGLYMRTALNAVRQRKVIIGTESRYRNYEGDIFGACSAPNPTALALLSFGPNTGGLPDDCTPQQEQPLDLSDTESCQFDLEIEEGDERVKQNSTCYVIKEPTHTHTHTHTQ